jgi:hypothetical protein
VLQVRAHRLSVRGVLQDAFEVRDDARTICVEDVLHPVERLSDIVEQQAADFSVSVGDRARDRAERSVRFQI